VPVSPWSSHCTEFAAELNNGFSLSFGAVCAGAIFRAPAASLLAMPPKAPPLRWAGRVPLASNLWLLRDDELPPSPGMCLKRGPTQRLTTSPPAPATMNVERSAFRGRIQRKLELTPMGFSRSILRPRKCGFNRRGLEAEAAAGFRCHVLYALSTPPLIAQAETLWRWWRLDEEAGSIVQPHAGISPGHRMKL